MDLSNLRNINEQKAKDAVSEKRHNELLLESTRTQESVVKSISLLVEFLKEQDSQTTDLSQVVSALQQLGSRLGDKIDNIPAPAEQRDSVKVENLASVEKGLKDLKTSIEKLELNVEAPKVDVKAPIVNVPETQVNVKAPDLKPLQKELKAVAKAVKDKKVPELSLESLEKLIKKSNALLKEITETDFGGGSGGGGRATPYEDSNGIPAFVELVNGKVPVEATFEGTVTTDAVFSTSGDVDKKALVDADRHVQVDVLTMPSVTVDPPVGGATEAAQDEQTALLTTIEANQLPDGHNVTVDNASLAITAAALPLPSGAATSAKQDTVISHLDGVEGLLTTIDADTGNISTKIDTIAGAVAGTEVQVDVLTMPTTTVQATNLDVRDIDQATDDIRVYANTAKDGSGTAYVPLVDTDGHLQIDVLSMPAGGSGLTDAELRATPVPVSGTVTANLGATDNAVLDAIEADTTTIAGAVSGTEMQVDVLTSALPSGASTSAKQDTIIGHVDGIETLIGTTNTTLGTIDADTGNISTKIDTVAGAVSGTEMQVDIVSAPTLTVDLGVNNDVTVTSGAITETNSAAIKTAVETIDNAISGSEMQVDVVASLPAGTNAIGKLSANSGVDIGDVDVTSAVTGTMDHGSNQDIDTAAEQITSTSFACKFGVTLRADSANTGVLYIGNSDVTVSGTAATDGIPLYPGDSLFLPVSNSNIPYAIASANNQKIFWVAA